VGLGTERESEIHSRPNLNVFAYDVDGIEVFPQASVCFPRASIWAGGLLFVRRALLRDGGRPNDKLLNKVHVLFAL